MKRGGPFFEYFMLASWVTPSWALAGLQASPGHRLLWS